MMYREKETDELINYVHNCTADDKPSVMIIEGPMGTGKTSFVLERPIREALGNPVVINCMNYSVTTILEGLKRVPRVLGLNPNMKGMNSKEVIWYVNYISEKNKLKRKFIVFNNAEALYEKSLFRARTALVTIEKIYDLLDGSYTIVFITTNRKYVEPHIGDVKYKVIRFEQYSGDQMRDIIVRDLIKRGINYSEGAVEDLVSQAYAYSSLSAAMNNKVR